MKKPEVIFIKVGDNKTKIQRICECIHHHFGLGHRILIAVANQDAAKYVDDLLWKYPEESFLPHKICAGPANDQIAIAIGHANFNKAQVLLNLQAEANSNFREFEIVYDLWDETHPDKLEQSQKRKAAYGLG